MPGSAGAPRTGGPHGCSCCRSACCSLAHGDTMHRCCATSWSLWQTTACPLWDAASVRLGCPARAHSMQQGCHSNRSSCRHPEHCRGAAASRERGGACRGHVPLRAALHTAGAAARRHGDLAHAERGAVRRLPLPQPHPQRRVLARRTHAPALSAAGCGAAMGAQQVLHMGPVKPQSVALRASMQLEAAFTCSITLCTGCSCRACMAAWWPSRVGADVCLRAVSFQPAKTNQLARSELHMHSQQHQHLLNNYIAFLTQQTMALLDMCRNQAVSAASLQHTASDLISRCWTPSLW